MYDQIREDTIFTMLYAVVMAMAALASIYLLFRRGNAFAADVTPPRRLRRWTAAFFGVIAAGHLWYLPAAVLTSDDYIMLSLLIGALLDCMLAIPLALIVMLCMLQDRRRPLWPVSVMVAPLVVGMVVFVVTRSNVLLPWLYGYFLLMAVGFTIYMVRAVRQYSRWLRDNYADLEHKEVWQSFLVLAVIMLMFSYYIVGYGGMTYEYIVQMCGLVLIGYLLWRVETLSDLTVSQPLPIEEETPAPVSPPEDDSPSSETLSDAAYEKIASLLQQHCVDTQLYLQHNLNISQLAQTLGTNRTYLSKYFAMQGITYNAYINDLRIRHFVHLYGEAVATQHFFTVQELASQSGYRNYNTFALAFKQRMGKSVTEWKQDNR
jgi:AraC-like DNA-binding protein